MLDFFLVFGPVVILFLFVGVGNFFESPTRRNKPEPTPKVSYARIKELEEWNKSWTHPELGTDTYRWDSEELRYVEVSKSSPRGQSDRVVRRESNPKRKPGCQCHKFSAGMKCTVCWEREPPGTIGSWCKTCQQSAGGADYCDTCERQGPKKYKLPNGRYVDTYEETICEVCKKPLPLYWARVCSNECMKRVGPGMRVGSWCKVCQREAGGAKYCDRCKENYGFRDLRKQCGWDRAPEVNRRRLQEHFGVAPDAIWGPETDRHVRWEAEQGRFTYVRSVLFPSKTTCKDCYKDTGHTIGGRCGECHWNHRYGQNRCKDTMCGGFGTVYRDGRCKGCYEVRIREHREDPSSYVGVKQCDWCGRVLPPVSHSCLRHDGEKFCTNQCWINYHTEP